MRTKYHFLQIKRLPTGRYLFALPGQMLGRSPLYLGVLVKDIRGATIVSRTKRKAEDDQIFFTTTLKKSGGCYTAKDIYPLEGHGNAFYADAQDEYDKLVRFTQTTSEKA